MSSLIALGVALIALGVALLTAGLCCHRSTVRFRTVAEPRHRARRDPHDQPLIADDLTAQWLRGDREDS